MTRAGFLLAQLAHHAGRHLWTAAAIAITAAVVTGALAVGDAVSDSLARRVAGRLGQVELALDAGDRPVRVELGAALEREMKVPVEAVVRRDAVASANGRRVGRVAVWGVGPGLARLVPEAAPGRASARLAEQLGCKAGDEIALRFERPGALPGEATAMRPDAPPASLRVAVTQVGASALELDAQAAPPANLFVPRDELAAALGWTGRANVLLAAAAPDPTAALRRSWTLEDAGLALSPVAPGREDQLASRHVFVPDAVVEAGLASAVRPRRLLTWLADALEVGDRRLDYCVVTGMPGVPAGRIRLNSWSANELAARPGDALAMTFHGVDRTAPVSSAKLVVDAVMPIEELDPAMMPAIPGLTDSPSCRDWDTGLPVDVTRIRPRDEAYWRVYRGTPKALLSLLDAQKLFASRFGRVTALRWNAGEGAAQLVRMHGQLDPAALGLAWREVGAAARAGQGGTVDFRGLFLGLSFFLVAAAQVLTGLVAGFHVERRAGERSTLVALGFPPHAVRRLVFAEAAVVALPAAAAGVAAGLAYTAGLVRALAGGWSGALAGWPIELVVRPSTLVAAWGASLAAVAAPLWWATRGRAPGAAAHASAPSLGTARPLLDLPAGSILVVALAALVAWQTKRLPAPPAFLIAGASLLVFGILVIARLIGRGGGGGLVARGLARRPGRGAAVAGMLAAAVFLLVALESQKLGAGAEGTGGYDHWVECTRPLGADPGTPAGRAALGLESAGAVEIAPIRVLDGDDASCLNLARAQSPRVYGVPRETLAAFGAVLPPGNGALPAVVDGDTLAYGLGRSVGDSFRYESTHVKVVGTLKKSVLQGALVVDRDVLGRAFPARAGVRLLLVKGGDARELERALADHGAVVTPVREVFARFAEVQNTYLAIFQVLGALGLLLGSVGLGVVVAAAALERRGELAMLRAVGFSRRALSRALALEHAVLFAAGAALGAVASLVALLPRLTAPDARPPWLRLAGLVLALVASGWIWSALAARRALSGDILAGLRKE